MPIGAREEARRRRAAPARRCSSGPTRRSSRRSSSTPTSSASGSRSRATCTRACRITFEDEATDEKDVFQHDEGLVDYLKKIVAERGAKPVHEAPFTLTRENDESGIRLDVVAAVDASRPTSTCAATSTASRPAPAARTRTASAPASARRSATSSRRTTCRRRA